MSDQQGKGSYRGRSDAQSVSGSSTSGPVEKARGSSKGRKGGGRGSGERREDDRDNRSQPRERGSRDSGRGSQSNSSSRTSGKGVNHFSAQEQNHSLRSTEIDAAYDQFSNESHPWGLWQPPAEGGIVPMMPGQQATQQSWYTLDSPLRIQRK